MATSQSQTSRIAQDLHETDPLAGLHGTDARCERYCEGYSDERERIGAEIGSIES
jgi:hypothetical protein